MSLNPDEVFFYTPEISDVVPPGEVLGALALLRNDLKNFIDRRKSVPMDIRDDVLGEFEDIHSHIFTLINSYVLIDKISQRLNYLFVIANDTYDADSINHFGEQFYKMILDQSFISLYFTWHFLRHVPNLNEFKIFLDKYVDNEVRREAARIHDVPVGSVDYQPPQSVLVNFLLTAIPADYVSGEPGEIYKDIGLTIITIIQDLEKIKALFTNIIKEL